MKVILFLILIGIIIFLIFYFSKSNAILKNQLIIEKNYNATLRKKLLSLKHSKDIKVNFSIPSNNMGIIKEGTLIYLSPIENNLILNKSTEKMEVAILDQCELDNNVWYYITLPSYSRINCRGWVKADCFNIFYDSTPKPPKVIDRKEDN
ncbi:MAG: hypothetical protein PUE01_05385 [Clostridiaceae bacterium]|nr:hypothetical protein [Clostridiaceae bacterium]